MNGYPEVVTKIVDDYMARVKSKLKGVPAREQNEFVMEIQSHVYEAYTQMPGEDQVARILAVLRNLGEPAEVVSERLPVTMVRAGTKRNLPLYILGGIALALFGIPLGFSGVGALIGVLSGLAGLLIGYYAVAGTTLMVGALFMAMGLARICEPAMWDRLVALGYIQMNGPVGDFLNQLPPSVQGLLMIVVAALFIATGVGMFWLGKHMLRGLRFLCGLVFNWLRQFGQTVRTKLRQNSSNNFSLGETVVTAK